MREEYTYIKIFKNKYKYNNNKTQLEKCSFLVEFMQKE